MSIVHIITPLNAQPELELRNAEGQEVHGVVYVHENEPQASLVGILYNFYEYFFK